MMKTIKYILSTFLVIAVIWSCTDDELNNLDFLNSAVAPTNVDALLTITQDNSGLVSILPTADAAVQFEIEYGDGTESPVTVKAGGKIDHTYAEGDYIVNIVAKGITGLTTDFSKDLLVSFQSPVFGTEPVIVNDEAVSKQVNVTVADDAQFAMYFDVYFVEDGVETIITGNLGETVSYVYANAGLVAIKVVLKGGAIETTEFLLEGFDVTEILAPIVSAPVPANRNESDYYSIFSGAYTTIGESDYNPGWGQETGYNLFDLNGDEMLQYSTLNYQGIQIGETINVTAMEYLHVDIWTPALASVDIYPLQVGVGAEDEVFKTLELVAGEWSSFDIPLTFFTDQGLPIDQIHQFKFVGENSGTIFVDNLYFWRESTGEPIAGALPINFEYSFDLSSFDGGDITIVDNPDTNGNSSTSVAQLIKSAGQTWAGSKITVDTPFEITESVTVTAKVWSPRAGLNLLMKFEDSAPWPDTKATAEITATTTVASAWEELTFTITGVDASLEYYNLVLIMDNGTQGDGSSDYTIFIDDISVTSFLDFETNFTLSSFDGGDISVVVNPDTNGNSSANVAKLIKDAGQTWAGSKITVDTPFEITESITITAKVWSPRAGLNLLMKFEDSAPWPDTKATAEITATTTVTDAWEELTFTITGVDASLEYYNLVLIMDNGTQGDGSSDYTIFIDDIEIN